MAFEVSRNFDWTIIRECGGRRVCPGISQEIENSALVCIRRQVFDVRLSHNYNKQKLVPEQEAMKMVLGG